MSSSVSYSPTSLEIAYGIHLLQAVFQQTPSSFRISGRQAVPFLSQSGVNRLILRNVWTVADPSNLGQLTDPQQFYILLRLTALAQAGLLGDALAAAFQSQTQTPVQAMQVCLQQTASKVLPLAEFQGIVVPSEEDLKQVYLEYTGGTGTGTSTSAVSQPPLQDPFFSSALPATQQQPQSDVFGGFSSTTASSNTTATPAATTTKDASLGGFSNHPPTSTTSGWDALDALASATDAPLPGLGTLSSTSAPAAAPEQPTDFGDFSTAGTSHATTTEPQATIVELPPPEAKEEDAFGDFATTTTTTAPNIAPSSGMTSTTDVFGEFAGSNNSSNNHNPVKSSTDNFGKFAETSSTPQQQQQQQQSTADPFDALDGAVTDAPLPALGGGLSSAAEPQNTTTDSADFGAFGSAATANDNAFGALSDAVPDANLAGLSTDNGGEGNQMEPPRTAADNDPFGDFASTKPATASSTGGLSLSVAEKDSGVQQASIDDDFGAFVGRNETTAVSQPTMGVSAFDALGSTADAPLPGFGELSSSFEDPGSGVQQARSSGAEESVFGDFVVGDKKEAHQPAVGMGAFDALAGVGDAPLPGLSSLSTKEPDSVVQQAQSVGAEDDCFGDFVGGDETKTSQLPAPGGPSIVEPDSAVQRTQTAGKVDDFGDFVGGDETKISQATSMDAFDGLSSTPDAPLPGLGELSSSFEEPDSGVQQTPSVGLDDDFGDFVDGNKTGEMKAGQTGLGMGAFDALENVEDAPLPTLGGPSVSLEETSQEKVTAEGASDNDFGQFASGHAADLQATQPTSIEGTGGSDALLTQKGSSGDDFGDFSSGNSTDEKPVTSGMDSFDTLGGAVDAPLPTLGATSSSFEEPLKVQSNAAEFGDFVGGNSTEQEEVREETENNKTIVEGGVGNQGAQLPAVALQSQELRSNHVGQSQESDSGEIFGTGSSGEVEKRPSQPQEPMRMDAFDAFSDVQDAPLPALGAFSSSMEDKPPAQNENVNTNLPTQTTSADRSAEFGDFASSEMVDEKAAGTTDLFGSAQQDQSGGIAFAGSGDSDFGDLQQSDSSNRDSAFRSHPISMKSDEPAAGSVPQRAGLTDRVDSAYYSAAARTESVFSEDYQDALEVAEPSNDLGLFGTDQNATESAATDDPFAAFETPAQQPLKPLSSFGVDEKAEYTATEPQPEKDVGTNVSVPVDDEFGDFNSTDSQTCKSEEDIKNVAAYATDPVEPPEAEENGASGLGTTDVFGDFAAPSETNAVPHEVADGEVTPGATDDTPDSTTKNGGHPAGPQESDDFGVCSEPVEHKAQPDTRKTETAPTSGEEESGGFNGPSSDGDDKALVSTVDDFGDFSSVPAPAATTEDKLSGQEHDDFGDFSSVPAPASPTEDKLSGQEHDDFGDFSSVPAPAASIDETPPVKYSDEFGDPALAAHTEDKLPDQEHDDFGDFSSVPAPAAFIDETPPVKDSDEFEDPASAAPTEDKLPDQEHDDFGDFSSITAPAAPIEETPPVEDSNNFRHFSSVPTPTAPKEHTPSAEDDDDFGNFSGFHAATTESIEAEAKGSGSGDFAVDSTAQTNTAGEEDVSDEDFGDFATASGEESKPAADPDPSSENYEQFENKDGNFGDFSSFESAPVEEEKPPTPPPEDPEAKNLLSLRDLIKKSSLQLPEVIRRLSGDNGEHLDFYDCFDANIGMEVPVSDERKARIQRCVQIMMLLSTSHSKLASTHWSQVFLVAREELSTGSFILQEAACFSSQEMVPIRPKLESYVYALGEFVRVSRSIAAAIGDLLMLDVSSVLTVDTFASSWCSVSILKEYLAIERLWKEILEYSQVIGIKDRRKGQLESLVAIRTWAAENAAPESSRLCHLTLQPLTAERPLPTKTPVLWNGQPFMACCANFLANKCSFYSTTGSYSE